MRSLYHSFRTDATKMGHLSLCGGANEKESGRSRMAAPASLGDLCAKDAALGAGICLQLDLDLL